MLDATRTDGLSPTVEPVDDSLPTDAAKADASTEHLPLSSLELEDVDEDED